MDFHIETGKPGLLFGASSEASGSTESGLEDATSAYGGGSMAGGDTR
jgi:hypothetical protein